MFVENAQLDHMNAELVLSIVVWLSHNTRYCFRIITALLISAVIIIICVTMATIIGISGSNYHNDNKIKLIAINYLKTYDGVCTYLRYWLWYA